MTDLGLTAEFDGQLDDLVTACAIQGVIMKPYFGIRDCITQAKLWRQSRGPTDIAIAKQKLIAGGAPYLAKCLDLAGPQSGKWATNALPGESWHQFGTACDCVWIKAGEPEWAASPNDPEDGYVIYAAEAAKLNLRTLGSIGDWGHVQQSAANSPLERYSLAEIDKIMAAKFGT